MTTKRILRFRQGDGNISGNVRTISRGVSQSNQIPEQDSITELMAAAGYGSLMIDTPYNIDILYRLKEQSSMIPQCVDAMVTNTVSAGWEVVPIAKGVTVNEDEKDEAQSFIDRANAEESLSTVVGKVVDDWESIGFGFLEVIRDATDRVAIARHASSRITRACQKHPTAQKVRYDMRRGKRVVNMVEFKRFRKYVQNVNGRLVWFKEFGDPRKMDSRTGIFQGEPGFNGNKDYLATEIIHFRDHSNDAYGQPKWIGLVPALIGSRESEEVNMRYFEDNMIPPVLLTIAGGRLTDSSFKEMKRVLSSDRGSARQNRMILLEAVSDSDSLDKTNPVQIRVDKLASERPTDGLFKEYKEGNQADVRSAFRLPPVAVGMSQDANFATANVSQFVAETQVFAPRRAQIDEVLNNLLINGRNGFALQTVKIVSDRKSVV